jgi:hypothetical protein
MNSISFLDYILSTEELAMAFSLVNRPDLGKAVLFETFGKLSQQAIEERLKAASHSLLARKFAEIGERGQAVLSDDIQSALYPIIKFKGMLQVVINNEDEPVIMNAHLGVRGIFTCHWVEQGVVHHITSGDKFQLPGLITQYVSIPQPISLSHALQTQEGKYSIPMDTFASLPEMGVEKGLKELINNGLPQHLAKAFLDDLVQPKKRGSVSYIEVDSENVDKRSMDKAVAGLFFLAGTSGWILTFPKKEKNQVGTILPGTVEVLEKCVAQLLDKQSKAFV